MSTLIAQPAPVQIDTWQTAEANAAAWMRHWGHADAKVTAGGPDGGIDVRSATALAQVKFEAAQVGAPAVQRLVGARGRDHHLGLYFFSGAGFARPAVEYADVMDVALFQYGLDGTMRAVNSAAKAVLIRASELAAENFPIAEVQQWARETRAIKKASVAASAGFLRRNGWLIFAGLCAYMFVWGVAEATGLTDPPVEAQRATFPVILLPLIPTVGSYFVWKALGQRRRLRAETLPLLPDPGPLPRAARMLLASVPGAQPGASTDQRIEAVKHLNNAVRGLTLADSKTVVDALADGP